VNRGRTRSQRIRRQKFGGSVALLVGCLAIVAVIAAYFTLGDTPVDNKGCAPSGPSSVTVVIVDSTDALTPVQQLALKNELTNLIDQIPIGGGIQFWRVAPTATALPAPADDMRCNPGKRASPWTSNPAQVEAIYRERFEAPTKQLAAKLAEGQPETASPIMETVQTVGLKVFAAPRFVSTARRRLIVASDLIQNSPSFNQLTSVGSFESFRTSDLFQKLSAPLNGVDVEVLYLRRAGSPQGQQHIEFWQQYVAASGGSLVHLKSITGLS
jgi:hypothetical protein